MKKDIISGCYINFIIDKVDCKNLQHAGFAIQWRDITHHSGKNIECVSLYDMLWHHFEEYSDLRIQIAQSDTIKVAHVTNKKWNVSSNKCVLDNAQGKCLDVKEGMGYIADYLIDKQYFKSYTIDLGGLIKTLAALTIKKQRNRNEK